MKPFVTLALLVALVIPALTPPPAAARTLCDDLADAIKASQTKVKRYKLLLKLFGDCNDLDEDEKSILKKAIEELGSGKAKMKKFTPKPTPQPTVAPHLVPGLTTAASKAPPDKRLAFTGKPGFPFGFLEWTRIETGAFDVRVTLAVGDTGLQNTVTGGSLRLDRPLPDEQGMNGFATFLDVAWLEANQGFLVTVRDDAHASLGSLVLVGHTQQIDLRMEQTDTTFTIYVRATPDDRTSDDGWQTVYTNAQAVDETPLSFGLIARGLDQKATVFFDFFRLTGPEVGGAVERPLINQIGATVNDPRAAADDAASDDPDLAAASAALQQAIDGIIAVQAAVQAVVDAHTLQASTDGKGAIKQLGKASKALTAAKKLADKGDPTAIEKVDKKILDAARDVAVATANLFGMSVSSFKKLTFGHPIQ